MRGGFASRFALEAGFLVLLAVGVGFADLRRAWIALVMACGWLLVTGFEWIAWRSARRVEAAVALPPIRPAQVEAPRRDVELPAGLAGMVRLAGGRPGRGGYARD